jgi:CRISPR/Cas system-associated exonuclease Cas4 (RecB family)
LAVAQYALRSERKRRSSSFRRQFCSTTFASSRIQSKQQHEEKEPRFDEKLIYNVYVEEITAESFSHVLSFIEPRPSLATTLRYYRELGRNNKEYVAEVMEEVSITLLEGRATSPDQNTAKRAAICRLSFTWTL